MDFCLEVALFCDHAGFAVVTFGDQHFNNYEPYCSPFTMIAALAGHMERSYLGTTVIPLLDYHPFRFAEYCNIVDIMTRGRCLLGTSAGSQPQLLKNFGMPAGSGNLDVFNQKLDVVLKAWAHEPSDPPLEFETPQDRGWLPTRIMPTSYRNPHPLMAIGTNSDHNIIAAAKRGWPVYLGRYRLEESAHKMKVYRDALLAADHSEARSAECLKMSSVTKTVLVAETDEKAWALAEQRLRPAMDFLFSYGSRTGREDVPDVEPDTRSMRAMWEDTKTTGNLDTIGTGAFGPADWVQCEVLVGSVETVVKELEKYRAAGVEHLNVRFLFGPLDPPEIMRNLELFAKEVMPTMGSETLPGPLPEHIREEHRTAPKVPTPYLDRIQAARRLPSFR
ncbi:LLM class flavin-dependent oxidoreductase [Sphingomonas tabacisoli]|uniref:LLM class flavin-dependent oxidoreductase n=1 Tax=Sphingomonas tabacisoli TaxID=2249466 RepID=A0ABW4I1R2_9SPHN